MSKLSFLWKSYCMLTMKNIFVSVLADLQIVVYVDACAREYLVCSILGNLYGRLI